MRLSPLAQSALRCAALCLAIACDPRGTTPSDHGVGTLASVSTGTTHTCALTPEGAAYCWGANFGMTPSAIVMPSGTAFATVSSGGDHTCGLTHEGTPYCWGYNADGEVGDGTTTDRLTPVAVLLPAGLRFASIESGTYHTCGLAPSGAAHCWGDNKFGQLGEGTTTGRLTPTAVASPVDVNFTSLAVGWVHSCGLATTGTAYCWGNNADGGVGDGTTTDRLTPTAVTMSGGLTFASLAVGIIHTCALTPMGAAYCWGANHRGRLGDGTTTNRLTPVPVAMPEGVILTSLSAGYAHTCGRTSAGAVYCWGRNAFGELGDATTTERLTPTAVVMPTGVTFESVVVGYVHSCGLTAAGAAYCWGNNDNGRLGDGTTTNRLTPAKVVQR